MLRVWSIALLIGAFPVSVLADTSTWDGYAGNAQHTASLPIGATPSQPLNSIRWQTPVDLDPQHNPPPDGDLYIHYGSPMIDAANTVIVPVKTGASGGFELQAFNGATGASKWTVNTDYTLPSSGWSWTPSYSPTLSNVTVGATTQTRLSFATNGGGVSWVSSIDSTPSAPTQVFVGGSFNANIAINTPLTSDSHGNIYFGYQSSDPSIPSGLARIDSTGHVSTIAASSIAPGLSQVVTNCAPAITTDGSAVYVAMNNGNAGYIYGDSSPGQLVKVNFDNATSSLQATAHIALTDPKSGLAAPLADDGSASPMIGPDGDVYYGVLDTGGTSRGWMMHFTSNLGTTKVISGNTVALAPGGFGWDDTASVVPASMVPSYHGNSSYLLMTKYNNYGETGGQGQNMLAILDPNAAVTDDQRNNSTGVSIMQPVETILGQSSDPEFDAIYQDAVREWCVNSAVVDQNTDSVLVNSEDGNLYRWNLSSNTFTQQIALTSGVGEAYTPTLVGPDGTVYAVNDAILFALGIPEPATAGLLMLGALGLLSRRGQKRRSFTGSKSHAK